MTFHPAWAWRAECAFELQARAAALLQATAAWRGMAGHSGGSSGGDTDCDHGGHGGDDAGSARTQAHRTGPVAYSFWLARSLPADDASRQRLLAAPTASRRLALALAALQASARRRKWLACAGCGARVATKASVFSVPGAEGVVGAYVNPHGVVHQTVTLARAEGLLLDGPVRDIGGGQAPLLRLKDKKKSRLK